MKTRARLYCVSTGYLFLVEKVFNDFKCTSYVSLKEILSKISSEERKIANILTSVDSTDKPPICGSSDTQSNSRSLGEIIGLFE